MKLFYNKLSQKGDTIVEVLIAVAIVGVVLTGAFQISNKSLKVIRQAQERSEAQKIAVKSMERLNKMVKNDSTLIDPATPAPFCISSTYDRKPAGDAVCSEGDENRYNTEITRLAGSTKIFQVQVKWDSLNGSVEDITFRYRIKEED